MGFGPFADVRQQHRSQLQDIFMTSEETCAFQLSPPIPRSPPNPKKWPVCFVPTDFPVLNVSYKGRPRACVRCAGASFAAGVFQARALCSGNQYFTPCLWPNTLPCGGDHSGCLLLGRRHLAFPTFRLLCMGPRKYTGTGFHGDVCLPCSWAGTGGERLGHVVTAASVSGALSDLPAGVRVYAPARGPV